MKPGQVMVRDWNDGIVDIGISIVMHGILLIETKYFYFATGFEHWELVGEL